METRKWAQCDLFAACRFMQDRTLKGRLADFNGLGESSPDGIEFEDGTKVAASSSWRGPYSEVTPDINADPPIFWVWGTTVELREVGIAG